MDKGRVKEDEARDSEGESLGQEGRKERSREEGRHTLYLGLSVAVE